MRQTPAFLTLLLCAAHLLAPRAHAGTFDTFGAGPRALSMGGAQTAEARGPYALFYNPAALALEGGSQVRVDYFAALPNLQITPQRPPKNPHHAPAEPPTHTGLTLAASTTLWERNASRVSLGAAMYVPSDGLADIELLDPAIPQWYRYDALPHKLQILAGASWKITDQLSLGAGFQSLAILRGEATIGVDLPGRTHPHRELSVELVHTAAPILGAHVSPTQGVKIGASWRAALDLKIQLPILFDFGDEFGILISAVGTTLHTPETYNMGASFDAEITLDIPLTLSADLSLERWSKAPKTDAEITLDIRGNLPSELGVDEDLDFAPTPPEPNHQDAWIPRFGAEYRTANWDLRGGYAYRPSALGAPNPSALYLDGSAHILSAGAAFLLPADSVPRTQRLALEGALQWTHLGATSYNTEDTHEITGPLSYGGELFVLSLGIRGNL